MRPDRQQLPNRGAEDKFLMLHAEPIGARSGIAPRSLPDSGPDRNATKESTENDAADQAFENLAQQLTMQPLVAAFAPAWHARSTQPKHEGKIR